MVLNAKESENYRVNIFAMSGLYGSPNSFHLQRSRQETSKEFE